MDASIIEKQGKNNEEPISNEKMMDLLRDQSTLTAPEGKLVIQKPNKPEEDKKVPDHEQKVGEISVSSGHFVQVQEESASKA